MNGTAPSCPWMPRRAAPSGLPTSGGRRGPAKEVTEQEAGLGSRPTLWMRMGRLTRAGVGFLSVKNTSRDAKGTSSPRASSSGDLKMPQVSFLRLFVSAGNSKWLMFKEKRRKKKSST